MEHIEHLEKVFARREILASADLNSMVSKMNDSIDAINQLIDEAGITVVTYEQLLALRAESKLTAGHFYLLTDYMCTTTQSGTSSAGHVFDLLIPALAADKLSERCFARHHADDEYFAESKLEGWEVWYCLDNDTDRFPWADDTTTEVEGVEVHNGHGVIYRLVDEFGNDCPYDFKNILFRRRLCTEIEEVELENLDGDTNNWETRVQIVLANTDGKFVTDAQILGNGITGYTLTDDSGKEKAEDWLYYALDNSDEFYKAASNSIWQSDNANHRAMRVGPAFPIKYTVGGGSPQNGYAFPALVRDGNVYVDLYTFTESDDDYTIDPETEFVDASLNGLDNNVYQNVLGYAKDGLNDFVFYGSDIYANKIGNNCRYNSWGNNCYSNSWGNDCNRNSWGNSNYYNSWGNSCQNNSWGNYCQYNSWGNSCSRNSWGDEIQKCTYFEGIQYTEMQDEIQYAQVLNGTAGTSNSPLSLTFSSGESYCQTAAKDSNGTLQVWCPADVAASV